MLIFDPNFDYKFFDESIAEEEFETPSIDTSLGVLIAGFSSRGQHNKIIENRTRGALKTNFGDDFVNYEKYGQANLHAMRLATSKARVFFCSLIPDDAKVAYSVFGVSLKQDTAIPVYKRTDTVVSDDDTTIVNYGSGAYVLNASGNKQQIVLTNVVEGEKVWVCAQAVGNLNNPLKVGVTRGTTLRAALGGFVLKNFLSSTCPAGKKVDFENITAKTYEQFGNVVTYKLDDVVDSHCFLTIPYVDDTDIHVGDTYNFTSYGSENEDALGTGVATIAKIDIANNKTTVTVTENSVEGFIGKTYYVKSAVFDPDTKYALYSTEDDSDTGMKVSVNLKDVKWPTSGNGTTESTGKELEDMLSPSSPTKNATVSGVILKTEVVTLTEGSYFDSKGNPTGFTGEKLILDSGEESEREFYPLFTVYYFSRGKGGNYFAYHISRQTTRDKKSTDGRRYTMYFYELLSTGSYKSMYDGEDFNFSFNKSAVYSTADSSSEYLGEIYSNIDNNSNENPIQMIVYNDSYEALLDAIVAAGANEEDSKYDIDILNAIFKNGNPYNRIVQPADTIDLDNTYITLDGGTDGSIEVGATVGDGIVVTKETAEAKKVELLNKFFSCDIDDDIFDEKITDIDVLPDENYPDSVKHTILSTFSQYRPDIHLAMDFGNDVKTAEEAISKSRELSTYVNNEWSFMASFYGQSGLLNDAEIDGSPRVVTATYDWTAGLADNFASAGGAFQMRAGSKRGRVKYFKPYWVGRKNKQNTLETLEELHINNIQYLNKSRDMVYMLEDTQYEVDLSKMMSVRNSIVVGRLIRMCAGILPYYKFDEENIDTTMKNAQDDLEKNVSLANIPASIGVTFNVYQTKADVKEENAHVGITVEFPDYIKKFHVEIRAKRPTSSAE